MNKQKKISKILICSLSVISIIAMLTLSAFAAAPNGYTDSGVTINYNSDYSISIYANSFTYRSNTYYLNSSSSKFGISVGTSSMIIYGVSGGNTISVSDGDYVIFTTDVTTNNVEVFNEDMGEVDNYYSINNYEYFNISKSLVDFYVGMNVISPEPLEKTYAIQFYNNDTYFSSIKVSGISNDATTFSSISSIKYGNTDVYSNGSWVSGYSSTIQYTSETAPDITTLNSDLGGIVTFSTQYREPNFWDGVMAAVSSLMTNIGTTANAIVQNEYLSIFCLVLPLLSLAVGLLVRMKNNG